MEKHTVSFSGEHIQDKHTHYEVHPYVGSMQTTLIILGNIPLEFKNKYGHNLKDCKIIAKIEYVPNSERVQECQDVFRSTGHLIGTLRSLDDIVFVEKI